MTVRDEVNQTNSSILVILSYNVTSRTAVANGSFDYVVNFTLQGYLEGKSSSNTSAMAWFLPNGTLAAVYYQNHNYTGLFALSFGSAFVELLSTVQVYGSNSSGLNSTYLAQYQVGSIVNETIGSVKMNVTTYDITFLSNITSSTTTSTTGTSSGNSTGEILKIGRITQHGRLVTYLDVYEYLAGLLLLQVTNCTRASYS
jgi:hypothetical protein